MYKDFFGLRHNPFNVVPDPRFLYETPHIQEALACLIYGVQRRKGFILLTGEVGTGKTIILKKFHEWLLESHEPTAFIFNPCLSVREFLDFMLADFGIHGESQLKSQVLLKLNQWLLKRYREGRTGVLIVDEAQNLSLEVLEEIRLLTNLETSTEKLLQIVLCGQPELLEKLSLPELRQLRQRITLRCKTRSLLPEETREYINARLKTAGLSGDPIFTEDAIRSVHRYSGGVPRLINMLCEHTLIWAFAEGQKPVLASTVVAVAREFDMECELEGKQSPEAAPKGKSRVM